MSDISKSLPSTHITEDAIMQMLLDHAQSAPTLDYAVLIEIRKTGYINSGELARKLNDLGFTQLEITQHSIDLMYDLKERPKDRRRSRKIVGYLIDFQLERRDLTRSFASYTGYAWGSGRRINRTPEHKTLELPFTDREPSKMLSEREITKVKAEFDKYRSWNNKIDWKAAQQHFMNKVGRTLGFEIRTENEIIDWVVNALQTGKLPASPKKIAKVVNYELKWLRENPRSMRRQFNMEYTPSNITLAVRRRTNKTTKELIRSTSVEENKPTLCPTKPNVSANEVERLANTTAGTFVSHVSQLNHKTTEPTVKKIGKLKAFAIRELTTDEVDATSVTLCPRAYYRATIEVDLEISTLEAHEIIGHITR